MQPTFNPWIGYFDLIDYVDKFVFLDIVQLNQQSWQTRNKLLLQGKENLFSLPVVKNKIKNELLIKDSLLDFRKFDFRKKLMRTLEQNYKKAKYYNEVNEFINSIVFYESELLSQYNINIIKKIVEKLKITTQILILSQTDYQKETDKGDLVLDICKYYNVKEYVSPLGSKNYLETVKEKFISKNINIYYQYYEHKEYKQLSEVFIPYIGIFDLLYNEGFENSINIIRKGRNYENR